MSLRASGIDGVFERAIAAAAVPGAVAAVSDAHGTIYAGAFGVARSGGPPLEVDGLFRLASMTKPVTSLAVLALHDEGRIDLDAPFAEYVPGYTQPEVLDSFDPATGRYTTRPASSAITIRQLLTHTSGYGYWFLDAPLLKVSGAAPDLFNPPFLMHEPGTRFAYGTSTDTLGLLVEPVTGKPLDAFLAERLLEPLGMADTGFRLPDDAERLMPVHYRVPGGFAHDANETAGIAPRGGGGLYGSAQDYLCLLRLLLNGGRHGGGRILSAEAVRMLTSNQIGRLFASLQTTAYPPRAHDFGFMDGTQKFGFGVMIETEHRNGRRAAGSASWAGILNTYFWVDPRAGIAAVLMTQLKPFCDPACIALFDAFERAVYGELGARQGGHGLRGARMG